jgi:hypothetical protein
VRGRARTWTKAFSFSPSPVSAASARPRDSSPAPSPTGNHSGSARRNSQASRWLSLRAGSASGSASLGSVRAPGNANSTARSTRPRGTSCGTQSATSISSGRPTTSNPRWGWPNTSLFHHGRRSACRLIHNSRACCGSTSGGGRMRTRRAPSRRRRSRKARNSRQATRTTAPIVIARAIQGRASSANPLSACSTSRAKPKGSRR